jgi:hypothetical protein
MPKNKTRRNYRGGMKCFGGICGSNVPVEEPTKHNKNKNMYGNFTKNNTKNNKHGTRKLLHALKKKPIENMTNNNKKMVRRAYEITELSKKVNAKKSKVSNVEYMNINANAMSLGLSVARNQMKNYKGSPLQKKLAAANGTIARLEYMLKHLNTA